MTTISTAVVALQARILKERYYDHLWDRALMQTNCSVATIDQHEESDRTLVKLCSLFWEALPDSPVIRTGPFFDLCDVLDTYEQEPEYD